MIALGAAWGQSGCQPGGSARSSSNRPMVDVTAADLYSWGRGSAAQQLEFYDELERRPIVSQDDAVHAILLLNGGPSATTYQGRLAAAKARGILDPNYSPPSREAVTVGEVSQMMVRALRLGPAGSTGDATATMKREGLIPEQAESTQGLTGAQMLAVLSSARDVIAASGTTVRPASPAPAPATTVEVASGAPAAAPVAGSPRPAPEPLPEPEPQPLVQAAAPVAAATARGPSPMPTRVEIVGAPSPMSDPIPELTPVRKPTVAVSSRPVAAPTTPSDDLADALLGPAPNDKPGAASRTSAATAVPAAASSPQAASPPPAEPPVAAPTPVGTPKPGIWIPGKPLRRPIRPRTVEPGSPSRASANPNP